jgi:hypothetical protein
MLGDILPWYKYHQGTVFNYKIICHVNLLYDQSLYKGCLANSTDCSMVRRTKDVILCIRSSASSWHVHPTMYGAIIMTSYSQSISIQIKSSLYKTINLKSYFRTYPFNTLASNGDYICLTESWLENWMTTKVNVQKALIRAHSYTALRRYAMFWFM